MAKISILTASLLLCTLVQGQVPMSPCPQYFTYITDPTTNEIKGQIKIPFPPKNVQLHLRVALKIDIELPMRYDGRLELARTKEEFVREQDRSLLYNLHFPLRQPIPMLTKILFNGEQYCSGPPPSGNFMPTIMLEHTLYPPNMVPLSNSQSNVRLSSSMDRITIQPPKKSIRSTTVTLSQGISNNVFLRPTTTSSRPTPQYHNDNVFLRPIKTSRPAQNDNNNNYNNTNVFLRPITISRPAPQPVSQYDNTNNNNNNSQCGISQQNDGNVNLLVANGDQTLPGQWPWLVALFLVRTEHKFQCAGSILTNKHIITVGHCLKSDRNDSILPNELEVTLGLFKLSEFRKNGSVSRKVADYVIHPDYAHANTGDSDLAILILRTSVEYSLSIKPICLWSGSTILQNVVNRTGYVVGWGQNEYGHLHTEEPRMARVPIVSQAECLRSDARFVFLTSDRTFCAGLRDNSGPCNGDSGSGLVLFDATTSRYQLRGIVSRSVYDRNEQICDLTKYIVFVDVAKYISWIREKISTT